jgi:hypothetical protein
VKRPHASSESDDKPNQETVNKSGNVNCLCNKIEAEVVSILPVSRARNDPGEAVKVDKQLLVMNLNLHQMLILLQVVIHMMDGRLGALDLCHRTFYQKVLVS